MIQDLESKLSKSIKTHEYSILEKKDKQASIDALKELEQGLNDKLVRLKEQTFKKVESTVNSFDDRFQEIRNEIGYIKENNSHCADKITELKRATKSLESRSLVQGKKQNNSLSASNTGANPNKNANKNIEKQNAKLLNLIKEALKLKKLQKMARVV